MIITSFCLIRFSSHLNQLFVPIMSYIGPNFKRILLLIPEIQAKTSIHSYLGHSVSVRTGSGRKRKKKRIHDPCTGRIFSDRTMNYICLGSNLYIETAFFWHFILSGENGRRSIINREFEQAGRWLDAMRFLQCRYLCEN